MIFYGPSFLLGVVWALVMAGRIEWYWLIVAVAAVPVDAAIKWWAPRFWAWLRTA